MNLRQAKRRFYGRMGRRSMKLIAQRFVRKHIHVVFKPDHGWVAQWVKNKERMKDVI